MLENVNASTFAEHLNTTFRICPESGREIEVVLTEVEESRSTSQLEQFTLIFRSSSDEVLPQRIYPFKHRELGGFEIFIVPIAGSNPKGTVYQACFSRLKQ